MKQTVNILLLEDTALDAELIRRELVKSGINHNLLVVGTKVAFQEALKSFPADIILSDHSLPGFTSHDALKMLGSAPIDVPFILITSTVTDEFAAKIMQEGAIDYILKDRLSRLPSAVNNAIEKFRLVREQDAERSRVNDELKNLNHRLNLATKSANLGVWDWDILTNKLTWDEGMRQLFDIGINEFESNYDAWICKLHSDDRDRIIEDIRLALSDEKRYETEYRIIGENGCIKSLQASAFVEFDHAGNAMRMIGVCWDVTKRKSDELEKEKIIEEMSRRNFELEQFSYIISHNLRAPLANIIGAANAMFDSELSADDRFYNEAIYKSAHSLDNIIQDLTRILEIKDGNYAKENVSYSGLVEQIKADLGDVLLKNDFDVTYDFPEIDTMFTVKPYLHSIFLNLIANSVKYRRKDVQSLLHITSQRIGGKVSLSFQDNGIGLNLEKYNRHLFGIYKRFHTDAPGRGLGLFMVRSQVELLGGKVSARSEENKGMTISIVF